MSEDTNNATVQTSEATEKPTGFWAGVRRIPEGLRDGSMIGLITGGITAGGLLALDAVFPGLGGLSPILGVDHAVVFTAKMAGLHAIAHAGLDAYTEYREGVRGIPDEKDMYHQYVESLEEKVKTLEHTVPNPHLTKAQTAEASVPQPNPATSAVIQAILAQGKKNMPQASWQDRVATQQVQQSAQDRTV